MDEFALCWKNFQDNIADGFHGLWMRGDLVDVTLACDGKLLHAHKIVLAICSPYFQEMFLTNPCKHPIIILKDVAYEVMTALLQFMYQGVVNVKHTELPLFMKIAASLQIKGLTAHEDSHSASGSAPPGGAHHKYSAAGAMSPPTHASTPTMGHNKRSHDVLHEPYPIMPKRKQPQRLMAELLHQVQQVSQQQHHRSLEADVSNSDSGEGHANRTPTGEDALMPAISLSESSSRFDLGSVKRETCEGSPAGNNSERTPMTPPPSFEFNGGTSTLQGTGSGAPGATKSHSTNNSAGGMPPMYQFEYPNDLHMGNESFSKSANHMDIPAGSNITMLSSTSLLHGNCVFNRNNTVATQQGMKTYWLCKSYRVSMCRARCITYQGRIITANGVHNHPPHMKNSAAVVAPTTTATGNMNSGAPSMQLEVVEQQQQHQQSARSHLVISTPAATAMTSNQQNLNNKNAMITVSVASVTGNSSINPSQLANGQLPSSHNNSISGVSPTLSMTISSSALPSQRPQQMIKEEATEQHSSQSESHYSGLTGGGGGGGHAVREINHSGQLQPPSGLNNLQQGPHVAPQHNMIHSVLQPNQMLEITPVLTSHGPTGSQILLTSISDNTPGQHPQLNTQVQNSIQIIPTTMSSSATVNHQPQILLHQSNHQHLHHQQSSHPLMAHQSAAGASQQLRPPQQILIPASSHDSNGQQNGISSVVVRGHHQQHQAGH